MKPKLVPLRLFITALAVLTIQAGVAADKKQKPLRALLITGGCCHNYIFQSQALIDGVAKHAKVDWTVINEGGKLPTSYHLHLSVLWFGGPIPSTSSHTLAYNDINSTL